MAYLPVYTSQIAPVQSLTAYVIRCCIQENTSLYMTGCLKVSPSPFLVYDFCNSWFLGTLFWITVWWFLIYLLRLYVIQNEIVTLLWERGLYCLANDHITLANNTLISGEHGLLSWAMPNFQKHLNAALPHGIRSVNIVYTGWGWGSEIRFFFYTPLFKCHFTGKEVESYSCGRYNEWQF